MVDLGVYSASVLHQLSTDAATPVSVVNDWKVIERWLGCTGRDLTSIDDERIGKAWKAYIAIGVAPSFELQPTFDTLSDQYKQQGYSFKSDKPPTEVMDVFDRFLASDADIKAKKAKDYSEDNPELKK
jgi:hypothetical protein